MPIEVLNKYSKIAKQNISAIKYLYETHSNISFYLNFSFIINLKEAFKLTIFYKKNFFVKETIQIHLKKKKKKCTKHINTVEK